MSNHSLAGKLTTAQRKLVAVAADDMAAAALNTAPMDRAACHAAIHRAYAHLKLAAPEVLFFDSPMAALRELQQRTPCSPAPMDPPHQRTMQDVMADPMAWVAEQIGAAQPRPSQDLGAEVDLSFSTELNRATHSAPYQPGWRAFANLIDKRLGPLTHYQQAANAVLEAMVNHRDHVWLLYSSGPADLWGAAEGFARAQALATLDGLDFPAPELALGRDVLTGCGWVNAFKKVCLVSDRPQALHQEGRPRDADGLRTHVTWRDGHVCEFVYQD